MSLLVGNDNLSHCMCLVELLVAMFSYDKRNNFAAELNEVKKTVKLPCA